MIEWLIEKEINESHTHVSDKFNQNGSLMNRTFQNLLGTEIRMINDRLWNNNISYQCASFQTSDTAATFYSTL